MDGLTEGREDAISLKRVLDGSVGMESLRISKQALKHQAEVAKEHGMADMAGNLLHASELVDVPDEELLRIYQLLRPGRATKRELLATAELLRERYQATRVAGLLLEAAEVYELRGLIR